MGKEEEEEEEILWNLEGVMRFPTRRDQLVGRVCARGGDFRQVLFAALSAILNA